MKSKLLRPWPTFIAITYLLVAFVAEYLSRDCGPWFKGCWDLYVRLIEFPVIAIFHLLLDVRPADYEILVRVITAILIYCIVFAIEQLIRKLRNKWEIWEAQ